MLNPIDKSIALKLKNRLKEIVDVLEIVIYGSRARGDAEVDSDMDVFIMVPDITPALRHKISELAWEVSYDTGVVITTFVTTPQEINEGPIGANPLLNAIHKEGVKV